MRWAIWHMTLRKFAYFWSWDGSQTELVMFDESGAKEFVKGHPLLRAVPWDDQARRIHAGGA